MKKNLLKMAFVSLFAVVAIGSCDEDEKENDNGSANGAIPGNTITATIENGSSYDAKIDSVKALIVTELKGDNDLEGGMYYYYMLGHTLATTAYSNGQFALTLPETVSDDFLDDEFIEEMVDLDHDKAPTGVTVSGLELKGELIEIQAYRAGKAVGRFSFAAAKCEGHLIYVDRDFSATGSSVEQDGDVNKYSLFLKKGFNMVYGKEISDKEKERTTTPPADGAKWFYSEYGSWENK